jgi:hypothetical protein
MKRVKPPFSSSPEINRAMDLLRKGKIGSSVDYADISTHVGENVQKQRGHHVLLSARKRLERDEHIVFTVQRGSGLIRCDDNSIVEIAGNGVKSVRRKIRRSRIILNGAEYAKLNQLAKLGHSVTGTILELMAQSSSRKFTNQLQCQLQERGLENLPAFDLVKLLKAKK